MAYFERPIGKRDAEDILEAIERHSVEQTRAVLDGGLHPRSLIRGKSLVDWLTEMYSRGANFPRCVRLLLDRGAVLDDSSRRCFSNTPRPLPRLPARIR